MASTCEGFVWDESCFRLGIEIPPLTLLVAPTRLLNRNFAKAIPAGVNAVQSFVDQHELNDLLATPSCRIDNLPMDPGSSEADVFIEPGMVLKENAEVSKLLKLLNDPQSNPENTDNDAICQPLKLVELPAREWAVYRLRGSYSLLPMACGTVFQKIQNEGRVPNWDGAGFHQHYITYPPTKDEDLITEIRVHLKPASD